MRLQEVEKGGGVGTRLLIKFISLVSEMRLPDAARIVMYYKDFYGDPMTAWTHPVMRGESSWSVGDRELMAALTAKWNACPFCIDAHSSIASMALDRSLVQSALDDYRRANLSPKLKMALVFLEKLALRPEAVAVTDIRAILDSGVGTGEIEDAMAVVTLFSITVRCANTFGFALLNGKDSEQAARRMLAQGYAWGKSKSPAHPDHRALAEALRRRVLEGPGATDMALRQAVANRATGGPAIGEPFDRLSVRIGEASYKVTDEQVKRLVAEVKSEKAAFEIIVSAAVGAGLYRWRRGLDVLTNAMG